MKIKYVHRLVSKLLFVFFIVFSPAQNKTLLIDNSEKFIAGKLTFRDVNINGRLDVYEDYRKPAEQKGQDLISKKTMLCLIHDAFSAHPKKNDPPFNHLKS